jgi:hypothetical protein
MAKKMKKRMKKINLGIEEKKIEKLYKTLS